MKKIITVLPLLFVLISPAFADSADMKVNTVKNMYNETIKLSRNGYDTDTLNTLFNYANRDLQNAVAISMINRMNLHADGGGTAECFAAYDILNLNPVNGYSINEAENINYRVLNNGKVRASIMYLGSEDIRRVDLIPFRDFSLKCANGNCKIEDVFDYKGDSGKFTAEKLCR